VLVIVSAVAAGVWWFRFSPVDVEVHRTTSGALVADVLGTGTLESPDHARVGARITGRLARVLVDQGDRVKADQIIATLDDGDLKQKVQLARAELAVARASVDRADGAVVRAEANARLARTTYERTRQLVELSAASIEELDQARQQRDVAEADLELAALARAEAVSVVTRAEQALLYDEERLRDTRVRAPFDGLVVARTREPGEVVVPGGTILEIVATDRLWVSAWVDETAMALIAVGQPARIVFRSQPDASISARVSRLAPRADAETREFLVDVTPDELPANWAVHQRAEVYIESGRRDDVVIVPQRLVVWREGAPGVLRVESDEARWTSISLGLRGSDVVEVTEGLRAGELVVDTTDEAEPPREGRRLRYARP